MAIYVFGFVGVNKIVSPLTLQKENVDNKITSMSLNSRSIYAGRVNLVSFPNLILWFLTFEPDWKYGGSL